MAKKEQKKPDYSEFESLADQKPAAPDYSEFESLADAPEPHGLLRQAGQDALDALAWVGNKYDRFAGAPSRAAVGSLLEGNFSDAPGKFAEQFGAPPELAPTGAELYDKTHLPVFPLAAKGSLVGQSLEQGMGRIPTSRDVGGLLFDVGADVTNLVPLGAAAKLAGRGAKAGLLEGGKLAGRAAALGADVLTGTEAGTRAAERIAKATERSGAALKGLLSPERAQDLARFEEIAKGAKIAPEELSASVQYGPKSGVSKLERFLMEGPAGEDLQKQFVETSNKITEAAKNAPEKIGAVVPKENAGQLIRNSFQEAQDKMFNDIDDMTMSQVQKYAPGLQLNKESRAAFDSTLNGIDSWIKGVERRGLSSIEKSEAQEMKGVVEGLRNGTTTYKQSVEALQRLGKIAFEEPDKAMQLGRVSAPTEKLSDLYFGLQDAVIDTIRKDINPEFADQIVNNNQLMTKFFKERDVLKNVLESGKIAPENVFKKLIEHGDSRQIEALKKTLSPDSMNQLKATYLDSLIKTNSKGDVLFDSTINSLKSKKDHLGRLFSPEELKPLNDLLELGSRQGVDKLSMSGTGASVQFKDIIRGIFNGEVARGTLDYLKRPKAVLPPVKRPGLLQEALQPRGLQEGRLKTLQSIAPSTYERGGQNE